MGSMGEDFSWFGQKQSFISRPCPTRTSLSAGHGCYVTLIFTTSRDRNDSHFQRGQLNLEMPAHALISGPGLELGAPAVSHQAKEA